MEVTPLRVQRCCHGGKLTRFEINSLINYHSKFYIKALMYYTNLTKPIASGLFLLEVADAVLASRCKKLPISFSLSETIQAAK